MFVFAGALIAISLLLARLVDRPRGQPRERSRAQKLLLGFRPVGRIAGVVHVLYWLTLFVLIMGSIGIVMQFWEKDPDVWDGVLGLGFFAAFGIVVRSAALVLDQHEPAVETLPDRATSAASGGGQ